jgi:membrane protease YdiL (CAAX protease family)
MTSPEARPSWRPAAVASLAFGALVAAAPIIFWAGDCLDHFVSLGFAPWAYRPNAAQSVVPAGLGPLLLAVVVIATALMLGVAQERGLARALNLRLPRARPVIWVGLVLVPLGVCAGMDSVSALLPWWQSEICRGPDPRALTLLTAAVVAPLGEELLFRGLLQSSISHRWGRRVAVLASAIAFSVWHTDLPRAPTLFLAGLAMGWGLGDRHLGQHHAGTHRPCPQQRARVPFRPHRPRHPNAGPGCRPRAMQLLSRDHAGGGGRREQRADHASIARP